MSIYTDTQELKKLFEAEPVFKPASKINLRKREEEKQNRKWLCPHCSADLKEVGLYEMQTCEVKWPMEWSKEYNAFEHTESGLRHPDIIDAGDRAHFCHNCDQEIELDVDFEEA